MEHVSTSLSLLQTAEINLKCILYIKELRDVMYKLDSNVIE